MADAVEVGADLGSQDALGEALFNDVSVQVGFHLFGFQVKLICRWVPLPLIFPILPGFGDELGGQDLDAAAIFLGKVVAQLLFQFFRIRDLFHIFAGRNSSKF